MSNIQSCTQIFDQEVQEVVRRYKSQLQGAFTTIVDQLSQPIEFRLTDDGDVMQLLLCNVPNTPGIYMFEVYIEDIVVLEAFKYAYINGRPEKTPRIIESRYDKWGNKMDEQCAKDNWVCLYVGKRKKLRSRVKEHILFPTNSQTYALKLSKNLDLKDYLFRFRVLPVTTYHYDITLPMIEQEFRQHFSPIIGRQ